MSEFHMVVRFEAAPGKREELLAHLKSLEIATQSEPGCLYYILNVDRDDSNIFYFREAWSSREAHAVHDQTPHIEAFRALKDELTTSITAFFMSAL